MIGALPAVMRSPVGTMPPRWESSSRSRDGLTVRGCVALGEIVGYCINRASPRVIEGTLSEVVTPRDLVVTTTIDIGLMQNQVVQPGAASPAGVWRWTRRGRS